MTYNSNYDDHPLANPQKQTLFEWLINEANKEEVHIDDYYGMYRSLFTIRTSDSYIKCANRTLKQLYNDHLLHEPFYHEPQRSYNGTILFYIPD